MNLKKAFTISELLIAMSVIGVVIALVTPSLMRNTMNKGFMTTLTNTIQQLDGAVQKSMMDAGTNDVKDSTVVKNISEFINTLDVTNTNSPSYSSSYKYYDNNSYATVTSPSTRRLLKNGVQIGFRTNDDETAIILDLNGGQGPNIAGVDVYTLKIYWDEDIDNNIHSGDIGGYTFENEDLSTLKNACKTSNVNACYRAAELSGFDPNYLEN